MHGNGGLVGEPVLGVASFVEMPRLELLSRLSIVLMRAARAEVLAVVLLPSWGLRLCVQLPTRMMEEAPRVLWRMTFWLESYLGLCENKRYVLLCVNNWGASHTLEFRVMNQGSDDVCINTKHQTLEIEACVACPV